MNFRVSTAILALCILMLPAVAGAQARGRTDGPEGSEIGKGGYVRPTSGNISLSLDWGGALATGPQSGAGVPIFVGLNAGYWLDDWMVLELNPQYVFRTGDINLLVGPRFRTPAFPVALTGGLKAGAIFVDGRGVRFGLSPQAGLDVVVRRNVLAGLNYALDIPIGAPGYTHRVFMSIGYRF